jgi:hypothetical protein
MLLMFLLLWHLLHHHVVLSLTPVPFRINLIGLFSVIHHKSNRFRSLLAKWYNWIDGLLVISWRLIFTVSVIVLLGSTGSNLKVVLLLVSGQLIILGHPFLFLHLVLADEVTSLSTAHRSLDIVVCHRLTSDAAATAY